MSQSPFLLHIQRRQAGATRVEDACVTGEDSDTDSGAVQKLQIQQARPFQ